MANDMKRGRRRSQRRGIPIVLVILLLVIAIAMGVLIGFFVARRNAPVNDEMEKANERIIELENTLTLIGFNLDDDDPEDWIFNDRSQADDPTAELAGVPAQAAEDDLWIEDDSLLSGTLDEKSDPVVVAEFDGGQLLSTEVIPEFNDQLTTQIFAGYSAEEVSDSVLQTVLSYMAAEKVIAVKAGELGLSEITDEDLRAVNAEADEMYDAQREYYAAFVYQEGMTEDELRAAAERYMAEEAHVTRESIVEDLKRDLPTQKYREYITRDITVTDDEIRQHYEERLADQRAAYDEYPEEYEFAHVDGETILYNPEGYRAVRSLLIPFESEEDGQVAAALMDELELLDPLADGERIQALEAELDPLYRPLEATAQQITDKLQEGEDFTALLDQYGADEMMSEEPLRTEGYYISDRSFLFSTEFVQGSMILEAPGQVSTPLRSASGLHLAEYVGDVAAGEVPLEDVYDAMKAETLEIYRDAYYEEQAAALLEAANVRYYPERLQ